MIDMSPEHNALREMATSFVINEVNPYSYEWDRSGSMPSRDLFRELGALGLLGINKPTAFGGLGLDYSYQAIFAETLGLLTSAGVALAVGVQTDMATPALARYGSDQLKKEFLVPTIAGESIAALGVSEPGGGSDVAAIRTWGRRDGTDYIINGSKMWMTNGCQADWICALVNTESPKRTRSAVPLSMSLIIIPTNLPGVTVGNRLEKLGMQCSDTAQVYFDDVRVPSENVIGTPGRGFPYQMRQFCDERLSVCLSTISSMRDTISRTVDYAASRKTFGKSIISNQVVQFRLSELISQVDIVHAYAWQVVDRFCKGRDSAKETAILKLITGRLVRTVNDECLQLWGGMGFMGENIVARRFRDQRLISIGGGSDEMMLHLIASYSGISRLGSIRREINSIGEPS